MSLEQNFIGTTIPDHQDEEIVPPSLSPLNFSPPEELNEQEEDLFEELITIGKLTKKVSIPGHSIYLSTLNIDLELQIGLLTKPFLNSDAYARAYKTAVVAASITELDGKPLYQPLSSYEDSESIMKKKFDIISQYYPIIIDLIYKKVMELEQQLIPLVEKLGKIFG